jgi:uncharacterized protein
MTKMAQDKGPPELNSGKLMELVNTRMPFGKYKGSLLCDLPEPYLVWFHRKGFPEGIIGRQLAAIHEIKVNGLEYLLKPLKK